MIIIYGDIILYLICGIDGNVVAGFEEMQIGRNIRMYISILDV